MEDNKQSILDERYMRMAGIWAENSYCRRRKVGALIVKDKMIISDGYNGTPSGFENVCEDEEGLTKPYVLHAEANAITKIARSNNSSDGATLYVTASPCIECAKLIIQAGIKRVVYGEKYRLEDGLNLLSRAGAAPGTRVGIALSRNVDLVAAVLAIPCAGGEGSILNGFYNAFSIIIVFPLIVAIGAGSVIKGAKGNRICDFLGQISYPLYITHYPLMYVQMSWVYSHVDAPLFAHVTVNVGVFILSIFIAWAALKLYDLPVREWLKKF